MAVPKKKSNAKEIKSIMDEFNNTPISIIPGPFDYDKWLAEDPPPGIVHQLPNDGAFYIPIGHIENLLDKFLLWGTKDIQFSIYKTGNYWFYNCHLLLHVEYIQNGERIIRYLPGGITVAISSKDANMDYCATAISFCIANASKRLGKKFGRALNGRLDKGETGIPIIQIRETTLEGSKEIDEEFMSITSQVKAAKTKQEAIDIIVASGYKFNIELNNIANSKS